MKSLTLIALLGIMSVFLPSCHKGEKNRTDFKQAEQTEMLQDRANSKFGLPNVSKFTEKRLMKELYELRDQEKLMTYAYLQSQMTGKLVFLGKSMGFGLPASVQYSNPQRQIKSSEGYLTQSTMPQAEPNGLFMPEGLSATWLFMLDPTSQEARPCYIEPNVTVSPFPLPHAEYPVGGPQYADLIKK